ncbi:MAG: Crp/Fnr family transcriptional regulator [Dehalococcoidales bacterium]|nr:Crp/Fnr family transcriptional regulator [Dehalococcoidales bacterium]
MPIRLDFLQTIPYFSGLNTAELESVGRNIFEKAVARGGLVLVEGENSQIMYLVVNGVIRCFKTSVEGKEQILNIARPGESFNDVTVFDGRPNPASAQAMGAALLYGLRKADMEFIMRQYPPVSLNVSRVLATRIRQLMSLVEDLSFRHVIGRLAKILLEYATDSQAIKPRLTQRDMAAMAGTAREVIGRSLKALAEAGAIRLDHHRIVVINQEIMKEMMEATG